ncbi:MAG: AMP-binding protein [Desulfobacterales bacterium]
MSLKNLIRNAVREHPEKTAIIEEDAVVRYDLLLSIIEEIAGDLREFGVQEGDLIGLRFPNGIAYIAITFAIWEVGAIVVPIGTELKNTEVENICSAMQLNAIIRNEAGERDLNGKSSLFDIQYFYNRRSSKNYVEHTEKDIAFIRFTSGTTGVSKGVVLSHRAIRERIEAVNKTLQINPEDTVIWMLSMAHHFVSTIILYLANNATIVIVKKMLAGSILEITNRFKGSVLYASPFHYSLLASDNSGTMLSTVRLALSTTVELPDDTFQKFHERYHLPIVQAYGIIEIGLVCINTTAPSEKVGSVGKVLPDYNIRLKNIRDYQQEKQPCGEILLSGPGFFDAYFSPWSEASSVMEGNWFDTGDIGWIDDDGYVYLVARKKEIINIAGMKVFPQEIESVLNQHPDIKESQVYGMKHSRFGELVIANVVPEANQVEIAEDELIEYCRDRLSAYKIPQEIRMVDRIQKTPVTSKIIRRRQ